MPAELGGEEGPTGPGEHPRPEMVYFIFLYLPEEGTGHKGDGKY